MNRVVSLWVMGGLVASLLLGGRGLAQPAGKASWPSFRGDPAATGRAGGPLPASPAVLWTFETRASVQSTAAIVGGVAYVGVSDGRLLALDLNTGKPRWTYAAGSAIEAAPLVAGDTVYVGDTGNTFHAVDLKTGARRWTRKVEGKIVSSANVLGDRVLFGSYDTHLYAVSRTDGTTAWAFKTDGPVHCGPSVVDGLAAIAGCDGRFRLIDVASGRERASLSLGPNMAVSPAFDGERFLVGTYDGRMIAVDRAGTRALWTRTPARSATIYACAAVGGGRVVFAGRDRTVRCLDAKDGKDVWRFEAQGEIDASPVLVDGRTFLACKAGRIYALDGAGRLVWSHDAGSEIVASPAVAEGRLVIGTMDGAIRCFGEKPGK